MRHRLEFVFCHQYSCKSLSSTRRKPHNYYCEIRGFCCSECLHSACSLIFSIVCPDQFHRDDLISVAKRLEGEIKKTLNIHAGFSLFFQLLFLPFTKCDCCLCIFCKAQCSFSKMVVAGAILGFFKLLRSLHLIR